MSKRKHKESIIRYVLLNYKTIYIVKMHFVIFFRTLNSIEIKLSFMFAVASNANREIKIIHTHTHTITKQTNKHKLAGLLNAHLN